MALLNARSRPLYRKRTKANPDTQNRHTMANLSMKSSSRVSTKNTVGKSVPKPQSKTTHSKTGRAPTSKMLLASGTQKETTTEGYDLPRKMLMKNKTEPTSRSRGTPVRKLKPRRIRTGPQAGPIHKHIRTQCKNRTHTAKVSNRDKQKEDRRIAKAAAKKESVPSGNTGGMTRASVRLGRRNAIFNAEEASKDAQAAAARLRAAQQNSRRVDSKQVLKLKIKQRGASNKRSSARQRCVV